MPKFQYKFTKAQKRAFAEKQEAKRRWKMHQEYLRDKAFKDGMRAAKKKAARKYTRVF